MEDGKGENFPSTQTSSQMDTKTRRIPQYNGRGVGFHYDFGGF